MGGAAQRGPTVFAGGGRGGGHWLAFLTRRVLPALAAFFLVIVCLSISLTPAAVAPCPQPQPCLCSRGAVEGPASPLRAKEQAESSSPHRLCLIVPFRDRFEELQIFAPHMHKFLSEQGLDFRLLILNQLDMFRFNRASLINAGWSESKRVGCDYLGMQDVDLLPLNPALSYSYPPAGSARHVASPEYHPRYNYTKFIGGILLLRLEDYRRVNGMSNRYWGWGLEDDEFALRLRDADIALLRPTNLSTTRADTFLHVHDRRLRPRDTKRCGDQKKVSQRRDRMSGLDSVSFEVLSRTKMTVEESRLSVVNVRLHCDLNFSPWCQRDHDC